MIELYVYNCSTKIGGVLDQAVLKALDKELSFWVDGAFFAEQFQQIWCSICHKKTEEIKSGTLPQWASTKVTFGNPVKGVRRCKLHGEVPTIRLWDGRKHLMSKPMMSFPTGLMKYARKVFDECGVVYRIRDMRVAPVLGEEIPLHGITLYDYQQKIVDLALQKQRGVVQSPTGSGKTEIFAAILAKLNISSVVYVNRTTLMYQTKERLENRLQQPVGLIGEGYCDIKKFNVAMIQTTFMSTNHRIFDLMKQAQCAILDECHHLPAESAYRVHKMSDKAYYRYGFSATPWRDDGSDLMIEAAVAKKIVHVKAKDLFDKGVLSRPYIHFIKCPTVEGKEGKLSYPKLYQKCIVENEYRNNLAVYIAKHLVQKGKTVLIAVTRIEHGEKVLEMLQTKYPHLKSCFVKGETDSQDKKDILQMLENKEIDVCVATTVFGEGVDVRSLGALINLKAADSSVDTFQLVGRVMRATHDKKKCTVVDFYDEGKYVQDHAKHRMKVLKSEEGYVIRVLEGLEEIERINEDD